MTTQLEINNILASSGNFTTGLSINSTGVSLSGHTHSSSQITDFNSAVSGLITGGSSVTEIYEYASTSQFPASGSSSTIYIATDAGRTYKWNTNVYSEIGSVGVAGSTLSWVNAPTSVFDSGTVGQIAYDSSYLYVCTSSNIWYRTSLSSWDPYYSSVILLLHFDGNFTDYSSSPKTITGYGSASADGSAKYGSASLALTSSSTYLRTNTSSEFALPGDFTLEAWIYLTSYSSSWSGAYGATLMSTYPGGGSPNAGWQLRINGTSSAYDKLNLYTGTTDLNWSTSIGLNQWYHVAICRSGSTIRAFVDGTQIGSSITNSDDMTPSLTTDLWIGRLNLGGYELPLIGRIDDLRITKGVARYTSNFTPSTIAFPNS